MTPITTAAKVLDAYSPYDYKTTFQGGRIVVDGPQWVMDEDQRRLRAYQLLQSYCENSSKYWLEDQEAKKDRREYGDPNVLVETTLSSLIGDEQKIIVDGSMGEENAAAVECQKLLEKWADNENFLLKMHENERQAVKLGDGVFVLGWDDKKKRPRLHVYDPGFYFPVFDERDGSNRDDYPRKVHICYEFQEKDDKDRIQIYVRKLTWELVPVTPWRPKYQADPSDEKCLYSDTIIHLGDIGKDYNTVSGNVGTFMTPPTLLDIDFIPVVHVPNTVAGQDHFGKSTLAFVMQILDDLQSTDTDLQAAAATTGSPPIVVAGVGGGSAQTTYGPGTILYVGAGSAEILDTSRSLDALIKLQESLLERLSINSRTPESLLGRVKPNEVPSGIALTLSFTPHSGMIKEMRLVRKNKYSLLFRMVLRMFVNGGDLSNNDLPHVNLFLGSFLPADKQEVTLLVTQLYTAKAISLETAVQMLMEAGMPIEDWTLEIQRIQSRDMEMANHLTNLTGNPDRGLQHLGQPKMTTSETDFVQQGEEDSTP